MKHRKRGPGLPPEQVLKPAYVLDPEILLQARNDANEKRRLAARLPPKVLDAIGAYLARQPHASNRAIASWLTSNPATARLVVVAPASLAKKIARLRK